MDITAINEIITEIGRSNHILLTAHHKLYPDSTGGILALYLICKKLGKPVEEGYSLSLSRHTQAGVKIGVGF